MILRITKLLFALGALAVAAVVAMSWYAGVYPTRLVATSMLLSAASIILVAFLMILIVRYLLLTLFAFLHHMRQLHQPAVASEFPPVSLIMPAYNEGRVIDAAIEAALALDYPNYEVIVVDDGSTDDTYEKALAAASRQSPNRLRVIRKPVNGGKASALNAGIAAARGELILCSDSDSRLDPHALTHAVAHFGDPRVGAVAGNVKVANRLNPLTRLQALEYLEGLNLVRSAQAYFQLVTVIPGPCGLFRKELLQRAGGFQSDTFAEDCDLTLRLLLAGSLIKYEPRAVAWTEAPEGVMALFRQRYRWGRGVLQAILKNRAYLLGGCPTLASWIAFLLFALDGMALPVMNLAGIALFAFSAGTGGLSALIPLWWGQLIVLDAVVALLCIAAEREQLSLALYAVIYRLFFVPFGDVLRLFSWFDEVLSVRMMWGRLERVGRI